MDKITRKQVVQALEVLNLDPSRVEEVLIFTDKVVVRGRDIMTIEDETPTEEPHTH